MNEITLEKAVEILNKHNWREWQWHIQTHPKLPPWVVPILEMVENFGAISCEDVLHAKDAIAIAKYLELEHSFKISEGD